MLNQPKTRQTPGIARASTTLEITAFVLAAVVTALSAMYIKGHGTTPALVQLASTETIPVQSIEALPEGAAPLEDESVDSNADVRWFNGKMVRPAKTIMMKVTAYSPDHRSCGIHADGQTATLHSVFTNDMKLVAADTRVLPFGSMITVPGYDSDRIVPVLDRGGAIKGNRLDLLFPTHKAALQWGVKTIPITVWEYADGSPLDNPRKLR
ncbi:MAG: 3D domain-containing protein [Planctomycetota bacterium]